MSHDGTEHSGEHPVVNVYSSKPLPGRRFFAFGFFLGSIALILAVVLLAVPLNSYIKRQESAQRRVDAELDCRNGIGNALAAAQATQISDLSDGLIVAFTNGDGVEIQERLNRDGDRIDLLAALKLQAVQICRDDPTYTPPTDSP